MKRNQKLAILLTALLENGMACEIGYDCQYDGVRLRHDFKANESDIHLIKESFTDEQAEHEYRKCASIIKKMKQNRMLRNPSLLFDKKQMTRNQKLAIKLINMVKESINLEICYNSQTDSVEFWTSFYSEDIIQEYIMKDDSEELAEEIYKSCASIIEDITIINHIGN